ncbi:LytR/AlgR family response regulator transcription factor [Tenacibaculum agarivorans]|uniref:LytR/AlgR family response regulator transcription factor n=1 Tax=Tenacibaculum agarivorans TaxID=1908389 RepID=UPI00094B886F|nr:LytTR family DNA-binding domain-containing protein [Tenacibaculum agarivorans]
MIKAILVDDETYIREKIKNKLNHFFDKEVVVVGEAANVTEAIDCIENNEVDLLLLDVHLKNGTSFDILSEIDHSNLNIIFITGFDEHAIKAIKIGALDYMIKPIDDDEFKEAIQKAIQNKVKDNDLKKSIEVTKEHFSKNEKNKRIILKTLENIYAVNEEDIFYCKSESNYTTFYTKKIDKIVVSKPIKLFEELLSKDVFIRCHKSYLVNKNHVIQYNKQGNLILNEEIQVPVSSRRKDYIIKEIFK